MGDGTAVGRRPGRRSARAGSSLRELPVLLLVALVLASLVRTFLLQVFYIPSSSMEPTLAVDDRIVVEKVSYWFREPRRGEIVVFHDDELAEPADDGVVRSVARGIGQFVGAVPASADDVVKRVIGLPGDVVRIEHGTVHVNDVTLDEPYVVHADGRSFGPYEVPDGMLFFLGDNRPRSSDSRFPELGLVERDRVVGRAAAVIWPVAHLGGAGAVSFPEVPSGQGPVAAGADRDTTVSGVAWG